MSQICALVLPPPWTKCTHLRRSLDISWIRPHRRRWLRCQGWWRTQVIVALDGTLLHRRWLVLDASDVYKNFNKYVTLIDYWLDGAEKIDCCTGASKNTKSRRKDRHQPKMPWKFMWYKNRLQSLGRFWVPKLQPYHLPIQAKAYML